MDKEPSRSEGARRFDPVNLLEVNLAKRVVKLAMKPIGGIAQMARASDLHSECREFKSLYFHYG